MGSTTEKSKRLIRSAAYKFGQSCLPSKNVKKPSYKRRKPSVELLREESIEATKRQTSEVASMFDRQHSQIPLDRQMSTAPARWSSRKSLFDPEELLPNLHEQLKSHKLVLQDNASPQQQSSFKRSVSMRRRIGSELQPIPDLNRTSSYRTYETSSIRSLSDTVDGLDEVERELNITGEDPGNDTCSEITEPVQELPPPPAAPKAPAAPPPKVTERIY